MVTNAWSTSFPVLRALIAAATAMISACSYFTSWEQISQGPVGSPIQNIVLIWGPPDHKWRREDSKSIYEYHLKKVDTSCFHYWVVNSKGTIVDYFYRGYCKPIG